MTTSKYQLFPLDNPRSVRVLVDDVPLHIPFMKGFTVKYVIDHLTRDNYTKEQIVDLTIGNEKYYDREKRWVYLAYLIVAICSGLMALQWNKAQLWSWENLPFAQLAAMAIIYIAVMQNRLSHVSLIVGKAILELTVEKISDTP